MKKEKLETIKNYRGFEYISLQVPVKDSFHGSFIDVKPELIETLVAKAMIEHKVPLRGKEVKFIRKVLGLSLERFAAKIDFTSGSILKWEKSETERLHKANEIICRAYFAEALGVEISGKFSELVTQLSHAELISLRAAS
jgi:DNA-binding transcriptional regulator YiaG